MSEAQRIGANRKYIVMIEAGSKGLKLNAENVLLQWEINRGQIKIAHGARKALKKAVVVTAAENDNLRFKRFKNRPRMIYQVLITFTATTSYESLKLTHRIVNDLIIVTDEAIQ